MSWPMVKLGDVAPAKPLKNVSADADEEVWHLNLDMVEAQSGKILQKIYAPVADAGISTHWFDDSYVLYSKLRPYLNKVVLPDEKGLATTELVPMLPDPKRLDRKYLAYYLRSNSFVSWISEQVAGAKMPRVSMNIFWQHEIPLPPLEEQKRIAAILDKADAIRQKRQKAIELADEFLRSVFLDMFGDPVTNPKGWEVHKCQDIFQRITVGVVVKPSSYYVQDGVPALRSLNIKSYGIEDNNLVYISKESNESTLAKSRVFEGDLVLVRSGQPGKTAVVTKKHDGVNAIDILIATPMKNKILPDYFAFFMNSVGGKNIVVSEQRGQVQQHFNVGSLNGAEIPVPPLELQNKFSNILNTIKNQYFCKDIEEFSHIFNSLSQKAFSGQL